MIVDAAANELYVVDGYVNATGGVVQHQNKPSRYDPAGPPTTITETYEGKRVQKFVQVGTRHPD